MESAKGRALGLVLWTALVCTSILAADACATVSKIRIPLPGGDALPAYCFLPNKPATHRLPVVIVGVGVISQEIYQYQVHCECLANRGFLVLLIDPSNYPEHLGPGPIDWDRGIGYAQGSVNQVVVATRLAFDTDWYLRSIKAVVDHVSMWPIADPTRIVFSGHSQPANAALTYACKDPRIKAVVWNYGGYPWIMPYQPLMLPPVAIFHGTEDEVYDVKYAHELATELYTHAKYVEAYIYPHQKHMFNVYFDPRKETRAMKPALLDSFERLVSFLYRTLQIQPPKVAEKKRPRQVQAGRTGNSRAMASGPSIW
ncbi:MAG: dienelactone hydrolase family protein [Thermodesulfobacteriota bacterium]